jgi:preprotein translocase subunit SecB
MRVPWYPRALQISQGSAMSGTGGPGPQDNGGANPQAPRIQMIAQYVKDLSFENPGAPANIANRPNIELGVDLQARRTEGPLFEVELKLRINAKNAEGKALFLAELAYAGLFQIVNIPDDVLQQVLLIEAPHLLFPYARRIISDVVRDGGMPPLMIEPIDFVTLYRSKQGQLGPLQTSGNA